jgi:hypothetical protein
MASDTTATTVPKPLPSEEVKPDEKAGYVKLAMRNMVKKGSTSLSHFGLTILGVVGLLIGLSVIFH